MSKGSRPRPFSVPVSTYNDNLDAIFGKKPPKEPYVPPPLPDMSEENKTVDWGNVKDSDQGG
jgi:hypothetical protein